MSEAIDKALTDWKKSFGGGMIPFDIEYIYAIREGATITEAQLQGGHALLDAFVNYLKVALDQ